MQRDLKIGLTLGIGLVAIVGALFFRRPSDEATRLPELQNPLALDEQIAERGAVPYLPAADEPVSIPRHPLRQTPPGATLPELVRDPVGLPPEIDLADAPITPIRPAAQTGRNTPIHNTPWESASAEAASPPVPAAAGEQTHVVQPGDTLTGLAHKYLGSHGRFREIYELNADLLPSPDRLPVGATLRIPSREKKPAKARVARPASPASLATALDADPHLRDVAPIQPAPVPASRLPRPGDDLPDLPAAAPHGLSSMTPPPPGRSPAARSAEPGGARQMYEVRRGDTLESIAQRTYGRASRARDIFEANKSRLSDPHHIREGDRLVLP